MKKNKKQQNRDVAKRAIRKIAERDGVTSAYVEKQIKIAMMNGLCSSDPAIKAFWDQIPRENEVPTPEELIIYLSEYIKSQGIG